MTQDSAQPIQLLNVIGSRNKIIHTLMDGPVTKKELPHNSFGGVRQYIGRLKAPISRSRNKDRGEWGETQWTVYYLYGDERRAVRKFIEVNTGYVQSCMRDGNNPLKHNLDDVMWQMFCEEWRWGGYGD